MSAGYTDGAAFETSAMDAGKNEGGKRPPGIRCSVEPGVLVVTSGASSQRTQQ